tara:strand:- start:1087 stop:1251 length:165 start_codon:yes stop_codon:yes gene_type:complete
MGCRCAKIQAHPMTLNEVTRQFPGSALEKRMTEEVGWEYLYTTVGSLSPAIAEG